MQPQEIVDFGLFLSQWSNCVTAKHQRDQLYRFGKFDDCAKQWKDVKDTAYAKLSDDEDHARSVVAGTYYMGRTTESTTAGVIWELKEQPSWDS